MSEGVSAKLRATGARLLAAAEAAKAYGLAAAHIGEAEPVVVIGGEDEPRDYLLLYNPRTLAVSEDIEKGEEGSVSLPGARVQIDRPVWVEVGFMDGEGRPQQRRFEGFLARVAVHEIEQMRGVFFLDGLSRLKRDMALKKAKKTAG